MDRWGEQFDLQEQDIFIITTVERTSDWAYSVHRKSEHAVEVTCRISGLVEAGFWGHWAQATGNSKQGPPRMPMAGPQIDRTPPSRSSPARMNSSSIHRPLLHPAMTNEGQHDSQPYRYTTDGNAPPLPLKDSSAGRRRTSNDGEKDDPDERVTRYPTEDEILATRWRMAAERASGYAATAYGNVPWGATSPWPLTPENAGIMFAPTPAQLGAPAYSTPPAMAPQGAPVLGSHFTGIPMIPPIGANMQPGALPEPPPSIFGPHRPANVSQAGVDEDLPPAAGLGPGGVPFGAPMGGKVGSRWGMQGQIGLNPYPLLAPAGTFPPPSVPVGGMGGFGMGVG